MTSLLVRHAEAGRRQSWDGPDEARPLTPRGAAQAEALVALLAGFGVARVLSSPYARCVQTVEPLAAARHLAVEETPALAEGAGPVPLLGLLRDAPLVLCSHGDVIDAVLAVLARDGVPLDRSGSGAGPAAETPKGATWVLEHAEGRVVGCRLIPAP